METTNTDLYAFGNRAGPKQPRLNQDLMVDDEGMIGSNTESPLVGPSTFANVDFAPLSGHYHRLPSGTVLPEGVTVVADGQDVNDESPFPPSHHTIYAMRRMTAEQFVALYMKLPWVYGGKK